MIIKLNNVCLIDLIGSEKPNGIDGNKNNQELLYLGNCCKRLREGETPSFRECKLTLYLKDSLAHSEVAFIGCVDVSDIQETARTFAFLNMVSEIKLELKREKHTDNVDLQLLDILKRLEALENNLI